MHRQISDHMSIAKKSFVKFFSNGGQPNTMTPFHVITLARSNESYFIYIRYLFGKKQKDIHVEKESPRRINASCGIKFN